jgi:uncharacterized protein YndB with AHSA1/START domain
VSAPTLAWPPAADEARLGLVSLVHKVQIDVPPEAVWRYACDAAHWAEWQPDTRKVEPLPGGPQGVGSTIVQHGVAGGQPVVAHWRVLAAEPGRLWVAAADTARGPARLVHRLQPLGTAATRFERTLSCRTQSPLTHWLDRWTVPRALGPVSQEALAALKLRLETAHAPPEVTPPRVPRWRAEGPGRR